MLYFEVFDASVFHVLLWLMRQLETKKKRLVFHCCTWIHQVPTLVNDTTGTEVNDTTGTEVNDTTSSKFCMVVV
jgi:adenosylmethionine-8-amino-7-oxononanoate aminotransferase